MITFILYKLRIVISFIIDIIVISSVSSILLSAWGLIFPLDSRLTDIPILLGLFLILLYILEGKSMFPATYGNYVAGLRNVSVVSYEPDWENLSLDRYKGADVITEFIPVPHPYPGKKRILLAVVAVILHILSVYFMGYTVGKTEAMKALEKYVLMDGTGYNRSEVPLMNAIPRQFFASSEKAQITTELKWDSSTEYVRFELERKDGNWEIVRWEMLVMIPPRKYSLSPGSAIFSIGFLFDLF